MISPRLASIHPPAPSAGRPVAARTLVRSPAATLLVGVGLAFAFGGIAQASSAPVHTASTPVLGVRVNGSDRNLVVRLTVNTKAPRCRGTVRAGHARAPLPPVKLRSAGSAQWRWNVPPSAPAGTWTATVSCRGAGAATATFPVPTRSRRHTRALVAPHTMRVRLTGEGKATSGLGAAGNPYEFPECTWYAWSRRPDLPWLYGNALDWARDAQADHIPTGTTPVAGAIVVFQPHQDGAFPPYGHVAYVESVSGSQMTISETNWGYTYAERSHVHTRTLPWGGLQFIYGGPAGNGPGQPPPPPVPHGPAAPGTFPHHVYHTCANGACGLKVHTAPTLASPVVRVLSDGTEVAIVCQTPGDAVSGIDGSSSSVWDKLADGTFIADYYVDTSGTNGAFSPPIPMCALSSPITQEVPPPAPQVLTDYNCPSTPATFGHYVPIGAHWGNDFIAQGSTITGGTLLVGAATDGNNHDANIGIYTGGPYTLSGELGSVTVPVSGYGGVSFTFPQPIHVTPGESLWLVAVGVGNFDGYDQNNGGADGCFIGSLHGYA